MGLKICWKLDIMGITNLQELNMYKVSAVETDFVKIEMESGDSIVLELDGKSAPITVANFKNMLDKDFTMDLFFIEL